MSVPHTAKSAVFSCIDDRLVDSDAQFIKKVSGAFHARMAGGAAAILSAETRAAALLQIVAAYKINHITDVYLENHTDCGAYRLAGITFASPEDELLRLYTDLEAASAIVLSALTEAGASQNEITIHLQVVDPTGEFQEHPAKTPSMQH